jgi:hypothetical protein
VRNNKTWSTYPWWLLLVGFAFGVLVTLWATQGRAQTAVVYRDVAPPESIMAQATQLVHEATLNAEGIQAAVSSHATANAVAAQLQPGDLDPLFVQATAVADQAVQR